MSEDWDDLPETSLDDDDYDAFVSRNFGAGGEAKGDPPVQAMIWVAIGLVLIAAVLILT